MIDEKSSDTIASLSEVFQKFDPSLPAVAIDFETYYDDEYSVSNMSYYNYCHHPKFNAFMVAVVSDTVEYTGPVEGFDWGILKEYPLWLAHNSPFDRCVFERLVELGRIPSDIKPLTWCNTIDVCAYKRVQRGLAKAIKALYGEKRTKKIRTDMKGRVYADLPENEKVLWLKYASGDARDCYRIWQDFKKKMPLMEHLASIHTSETVSRGVYVDKGSVEKQLDALRIAVNRAENLIPWTGEQELTVTGKPSFFKDGRPKLAKPTSTIHFARYLRSHGVDGPRSTDIKSPEYQLWAEKNKDRPEILSVMKAIHTWRKCNMLVLKFEHILNYLRPDGRMEFQLKYFGGHTGRWSGTNSAKEDEDAEDEKGLNMQNLLKKKFFLDNDYYITEEEKEAFITIDIRGVFGSSPGRILVIADAGQIEPRCLGWVLDDKEFLRMCAEGFSPYVIHAVKTMGYTGDPAVLKSKHPALYALAKARVLALGYGAGWAKFLMMAPMYIDQETFKEIFSAPVEPWQIDSFKKYCSKYATDTFDSWDTYTEEEITTFVNSWIIVKEFRKTNSLITKLWDEMHQCLSTSAKRNEDLIVHLPSGRSLKYMKITRNTFQAETVDGGKRSFFYGGKLVENLIQAIARDVFTNIIIELEKAGFAVVWHVHDEVIVETHPDPDLNLFRKTFTKTPPFMEGLPVEADIEITDCYKK